MKLLQVETEHPKSDVLENWDDFNQKIISLFKKIIIQRFLFVSTTRFQSVVSKTTRHSCMPNKTVSAGQSPPSPLKTPIFPLELGNLHPSISVQGKQELFLISGYCARSRGHPGQASTNPETQRKMRQPITLSLTGSFRVRLSINPTFMLSRTPDPKPL